jgi:hypothetical protein
MVARVLFGKPEEIRPCVQEQFTTDLHMHIHLLYFSPQEEKQF